MPSAASLKLKRAEWILFALGIGCLLTWGGMRIYSVAASKAAVQNFETIEEGTAFAQANLSPFDVRLWSTERIAAYQKSLTELTAAPIAVLRIPRISLVVPVFNGTGDLILDRGVGRVPGTAAVGQAGNLAIAGHRDGFFRGLSEVSIGDVVEVERPGSIDSYAVTATRVVAPEDISVLRPSASPTLTLITCFPFYFIGHAPQRYIVTAVLDAHHN